MNASSVASALPKQAAEFVLPYVLGEKTPERSLADAGNIREVADAYGYEKFGVGYVNVVVIIFAYLNSAACGFTLFAIPFIRGHNGGISEFRKGDLNQILNVLNVR